MSKYLELKNIIKDKNRIIFNQIQEKYLSDVLGRIRGRADAVIKPVNTDEVSKIMKYSFEHNIPVTPRGAGTNLVGSTVPINGGIVLDLSQMNRILEFDKENFTITVEPGIRLNELQDYVESKGFFYPPDPGEKNATIGGNISTNAGGMRAVKYGVTRDYVQGLELVLANGDIINVGSKNIKDSSGLSLKNIIIGSEGTLAVITKCLLKVIPKPESSLSVVVSFKNMQVASSTVIKILTGNVNPTAIEFAQKSVIELGENFTGLKFPADYSNVEAYLILTFDGNTSEVLFNIEKAKNIVLDNGAIDFITLDNVEKLKKVWDIRGCLVKAVEQVSEQEPVDIVVPINKVNKFIEFINEYEKKSGMQLISFGHAGDGNVHLCMVRGSRTQKEWDSELRINLERIYKEAYALGGLTSGEHGIGISKKYFFQNETSDINLDIMRKIKQAFDNKYILNNHKSYCK